jgi:hypothetical protein
MIILKKEIHLNNLHYFLTSPMKLTTTLSCGSTAMHILNIFKLFSVGQTFPLLLQLFIFNFVVFIMIMFLVWKTIEIEVWQNNHKDSGNVK